MNKHRIGALVAAAALTLTFAGTALGATKVWAGNGYPNETCNSGSETALWIWTGDNPGALTINGNVQSGTWEHKGNGSWHLELTLGAGNYPPTSASLEYTGDSGTLTLSHCDGETTTTTEETTTSDETTTSVETTTTSVETTTSDETTTTTSETTTFETTTTDTTTTVVEAFNVEPAVCRLDDPTSRIQIRRLVGLIALTRPRLLHRRERGHRCRHRVRRRRSGVHRGLPGRPQRDHHRWRGRAVRR